MEKERRNERGAIEKRWSQGTKNDRYRLIQNGRIHSYFYSTAKHEIIQIKNHN